MKEKEFDGFFRKLRKEFLEKLIVKQRKELAEITAIFEAGQLQDTTKLYKMKKKVKQTEKDIETA